MGSDESRMTAAVSSTVPENSRKIPGFTVVPDMSPPVPQSESMRWYRTNWVVPGADRRVWTKL
ncbi:hypothetical protein GCM10022238_07410 [Gordonia hankookensis]